MTLSTLPHGHRTAASTPSFLHSEGLRKREVGRLSAPLPVIKDADFAHVSLGKPLSLRSLIINTKRDWESEYFSSSVRGQGSHRRLERGSGLAQYFSTLAAALTFGARPFFVVGLLCVVDCLLASLPYL